MHDVILHFCMGVSFPPGYMGRKSTSDVKIPPIGVVTSQFRYPNGLIRPTELLPVSFPLSLFSIPHQSFLDAFSLTI